MHTQVQQHTEECAAPLTIKVKVYLLQSTERKFDPVSSKFKMLILHTENHTFLLQVNSESLMLNQDNNTFLDDFIYSHRLFTGQYPILKGEIAY